MSDPSAKITARRADTDGAVIGAPSKDPVAHGALLTRVNRWLGR